MRRIPKAAVRKGYFPYHPDEIAGADGVYEWWTVEVCPFCSWLGQCPSLPLPHHDASAQCSLARSFCPIHLQGQRSRCQDLLGAHLSSEASAKAKCPLVVCAKPASPLPRAGEWAGGLMPAFISSSVSGNQTGVSLGRGPPHTSGPRHAWVMWGHHIREPLPAGSWQGNSRVIRVSRCPWYSG